MTPQEFKEVRTRLGMSQEKFAQALNVSYATINRWETGKIEIDSRTEEQILKLKELLDKDVLDKKMLSTTLSKDGLFSVISTALAAGLIAAPVTTTIASLFGSLIGGPAVLLGALGAATLMKKATDKTKKDKTAPAIDKDNKK